MKNIVKYIPWLIAIVALILLLLPKACDKDKVIIEQVPYKIPEKSGEIKEVKGHFETTKIEYDTVFIAGKEITVTSPLDPELLRQLENAKTEIERYKVLAEANKQREYSTDLEDENISVNVKSTVFGSMPNPPEIKYKIKEQEIQIPQKTIIKKDNFGFLTSAGYNHSLKPDLKSNVQAGVGIRVNKLSVLATASTQGTVGGQLIIEF